MDDAAHIAKVDRWNDACIAGGRAPDSTPNPYPVGSDEHDGFDEGQRGRKVRVSYGPYAHSGGARNCNDALNGEGRFHGRI